MGHEGVSRGRGSITPKGPGTVARGWCRYRNDLSFTKTAGQAQGSTAGQAWTVEPAGPQPGERPAQGQRRLGQRRLGQRPGAPGGTVDEASPSPCWGRRVASGIF